jgi:hypothetical protein
MNLYKKYIKEKYDRDIINGNECFIEYKKYSDGSLYIYTLFVSKEARDNGLGFGLEQILIEKEKPTMIFCDIDLTSNNAELALIQIIKKAKYKIHESHSDKIILVKDLRNV